jgi:hypothetical protein
MDTDTIQKIAAEIAKHLSGGAWGLLVIQTILILAAAGLGTFFGEYFKTRGRNLATKADFDSLQDSYVPIPNWSKPLGQRSVRRIGRSENGRICGASNLKRSWRPCTSARIISTGSAEVLSEARDSTSASLLLSSTRYANSIFQNWYKKPTTLGTHTECGAD